MGILLPILPKSVRWGAVITIAGFIFYVSVVTMPPEVVVVDDGGSGDTTTVAVDTNRGADGTNIFSVIEDIFEDIIGFTWDQWQHFAAYGALAYALAYALVDWEFRGRVAAVFVILAVTAFGLSIELLQHVVPERSFDVEDVIANAIGAVSVLVWFALLPSFEPRALGDILNWK